MATAQEFLGGQDFQVLPAQDFLQGGDFSIEGQTPQPRFKSNQQSPQGFKQQFIDPAKQAGQDIYSFGINALDIVAKPVGAVAEALTSSTRQFGNTIGSALGLTGQQDILDQASQIEGQQQLQIIEAIKKNRAQGKDTTRLAQLLKKRTGSTPSIKDINPTINKSTGQVIGEAGGTALEALSGGTLKGVGQTTKAAATASRFSPRIQAAIKTGKAVAAGGGLGYLYDVAGNLQQGDTGAKAFEPKLGTAIGAAIPLVLGTRAIYKAGKEDVNKYIDEVVDKNFRSAIKPKTTINTAKISNSAKEGFKTFADYKSSLQFERDGGMVTGELPQNLKETQTALGQIKTQIFDKYNSLNLKAGKSGATIYLEDTAKQLENLANNKAFKTTAPQASRYALNQAQLLKQAANYTPQEAQQAVKLINQRTEAFFKNPNMKEATHAYIDAMVSNNLRKGMDQAISSAEGPGYQQLRNQYSALKTIEPEINRSVAREANKNTARLIDFTQVFSAGDILKGITSLDPATLVKGVGQGIVGQTIKRLNDPNRKIARMFQQIDEAYNAAQKAGITFRPTAQGEGLLKLPPGRGPGSQVGSGPTIPLYGLQSQADIRSRQAVQPKIAGYLSAPEPGAAVGKPIPLPSRFPKEFISNRQVFRSGNPLFRKKSNATEVSKLDIKKYLNSSERPEIPKLIEQAINSGDTNQMLNLYNSLPADNPYKISMESLLKMKKLIP